MSALLLRIMLAALLSVIAFSMALPNVAVTLLKDGGDPRIAGAVTALPSLMIVCIVPFVTRLSGFISVGMLYRGGQLLIATGLGLFGFAESARLWTWFLAAALLGAGSATLWPLTESSVASLSPADRKGSFTGLYQTALGLAFMSGPVIAAGVHLEARQAFVVSALVALAAILPAPGIRFPETTPAAGDASSAETGDGFPAELSPRGLLTPLRHLWLATPALVTTALIGGFYESGSNLVGAASALRLGFGERAGLLAPGVIAFGSFLAQYPVGLLSDRVGVERVLRGSLIALLCSAAAFPFTEQLPWLIWLLLVVWGGVGGGLYTLGMIVVAQRFRGPATLSATTAMIALYTTGGFLGPAISGLVLDAWSLLGPALLFGALALVGYLSARSGPRSSAFNQSSAHSPSSRGSS